MPDAVPACETARGCPIQSLAQDPEVNDAVEQFIQAKIAFSHTKDPKVAERVYEALGLYDDLVILNRMESIFAEYVRQEHEHS